MTDTSTLEVTPGPKRLVLKQPSNYHDLFYKLWFDQWFPLPAAIWTAGRELPLFGDITRVRGEKDMAGRKYDADILLRSRQTQREIAIKLINIRGLLIGEAVGDYAQELACQEGLVTPVFLASPTPIMRASSPLAAAARAANNGLPPGAPADWRERLGIEPTETTSFIYDSPAVASVVDLLPRQFRHSVEEPDDPWRPPVA